MDMNSVGSMVLQWAEWKADLMVASKVAWMDAMSAVSMGNSTVALRESD